MFKLNPDQQAHLHRVIDRFEAVTTKKFTAGAAEHGGNLHEMPTLEVLYNALEEAVDQCVYISTAIEQLEKTHETN